MREKSRPAPTGFLRRALIGIGFITAFVAVTGGLFGVLEWAGVEYRFLNIQLPATMEVMAESLRPRQPDRGGQRIAVLGDSMLVSYPAGKTIPERLQQKLNRAAGSNQAKKFRVIYLGVPSLGPADYYFLSDMILRHPPDQLLVGINLASRSEAWRERFGRPELVGWARPNQLAEAAALSSGYFGLTLDRVLRRTTWS
jgi:hypothetical protein